MSVQKAGELVAYVKECVQAHGATPHTDIYVRDGTNGPLRQISDVKMIKDERGTAIILETSVVLQS